MVPVELWAGDVESVVSVSLGFCIQNDGRIKARPVLPEQRKQRAPGVFVGITCADHQRVVATST